MIQPILKRADNSQLETILSLYNGADNDKKIAELGMEILHYLSNEGSIQELSNTLYPHNPESNTELTAKLSKLREENLF